MKYFKLALIGLLVMACKQEKKESFQEVQDPIHEIDVIAELALIEETRSAFQLAIKEKRYEDLSNYSSEGMVAIGPGGGEWQEYISLREKLLGKFTYDSINMTPEETVILSDSMAYDFGTSKVYYTNEEGASVEMENSFLVILKKDKKDDTWKLFREVGSSNLPALH